MARAGASWGEGVGEHVKELTKQDATDATDAMDATIKGIKGVKNLCHLLPSLKCLNFLKYQGLVAQMDWAD